MQGTHRSEVGGEEPIICDPESESELRLRVSMRERAKKGEDNE